MPGTILSVRHVFSHLILIIVNKTGSIITLILQTRKLDLERVK